MIRSDMALDFGTSRGRLGAAGDPAGSADEVSLL